PPSPSHSPAKGPSGPHSFAISVPSLASGARRQHTNAGGGRGNAASGEPPAEREAGGEPAVLVPEEPPELKTALAGGLLGLFTGLFEQLGGVGGDRHVAGEAERGVTVGQFLFAPGHQVLLPCPAGGGKESAAAAQLGVGQVCGAGL